MMGKKSSIGQKKSKYNANNTRIAGKEQEHCQKQATGLTRHHKIERNEPKHVDSEEAGIPQAPSGACRQQTAAFGVGLGASRLQQQGFEQPQFSALDAAAGQAAVSPTAGHAVASFESPIATCTHSLVRQAPATIVADSRDRHTDRLLLQGRLLFISLLENYCEINQSRCNSSQLFVILCTQLLKMGLLKEDDLNENNFRVRNSYRIAFHQLVSQAISKLKSENCLRAGNTSPVWGEKPLSQISALNSDSALLSSQSAGISSISRYLEDFEELEMLGKGAFGSVHRVKNRIDDLEYAVKKIKFSKHHCNIYRRLLREVYSLARLDHVNVVRYNSAWIEAATFDEPSSIVSCDLSSLVESHSSQGFESSDITEESETNRDSNIEIQSIFSSTVEPDMTLFIQMQLCHYTLKDWLNVRNEAFHFKKRLSPTCDGVFNGIEIYNTLTDSFAINTTENLRIFKQIVQGLDYIHSLGFIHRDLKPQNIFFYLDEMGNYTLKIGDFSLVSTPEVDKKPIRPSNSPVFSCSTSASFRTNFEDSDSDVITSLCTDSSHSRTTGLGTLTYAAPEQLIKNAVYDQNADIYSLGIIFFELYYPCYSESEKYILIERLRKHHYLPEDFLKAYPKESAFILWCTAHDSSKRPTSIEILKLEFLDACESDNVYFLKKKLAEKDKKILDLEQALLNLQEKLVEISTGSLSY